MRYAAILLAALLACGGTGYVVHVYDTRQADQQTVRDYNDGFQDGACTGSAQAAYDTYGFICKTGK
jgi:hypothetical protein